MRILVVGGTGGFGSVICTQLARDGHRVTAGGRTTRPTPPGVDFARIDRDRVTADELASYDVVVDAAGPFQGQDRTLARAAIAAGAHAIDIADDRSFVTTVRTLDEEARRAGVTVVSGASSVPALSSAVALELARGMDVVRHVEIAISASSRAAFGHSVLRSMLTSAGRTIRRSDGTTGISMTDPRRVVFAVGGARLDRIVLEVDGPDQEIMPALLPGRPSVRFRAGGELAAHNHAMRLVAELARRGMVADGSAFASLAALARRPSRRLGDGRSAMMVEVTGDVEGRATRRRWNLIAERDMGPIIPCLAVPAIVDRIDRGRSPPGARTAAGLLGVEEILSRMPERSISYETTEEGVSPLHARVMPSHDRLAAAVRRMHDVATNGTASGRADVVRGSGVIARVVALAFGFPPAGRAVPVTVRFERAGDGERWTRDFGGNRFSSTLSPIDGGVTERFGPFSFRFRLDERDGALAMTPTGWSLMGVPLPRSAMPNGVAREREKDGRFTFDVPITLPVVGLVVHYRGWLERTDPA